MLFRVVELYEYAMLPEHMHSPDPSVGPNSITETGALCISSGSKAGRVPKQKRIVEDDITRDVSTRPLFRAKARRKLLSLEPAPLELTRSDQLAWHAWEEALEAE